MSHKMLFYMRSMIHIECLQSCEASEKFTFFMAKTLNAKDVLPIRSVVPIWLFKNSVPSFSCYIPRWLHPLGCNAALVCQCSDLNLRRGRITIIFSEVIWNVLVSYIIPYRTGIVSYHLLLCFSMSILSHIAH